MPVTVLSIPNLDEVLKVLKRHGFTAANYHELGLSLGLLQPTLDTIKAENVDNIAGCLRECLSAWLRKVDDVESKGDPSYYTLIAALRSIGEKAVADGIEGEKCLSVYDGSGLNITKEAHAVNIFNRHQQWVRQLSHPFSVATILREEGINISDDTLADVQSFSAPLEERTLLLVRAVRKAVEKDYTKLRVFARVCKNVSDKDTAEAIMKDYGATFKAEATTEEKLEEEFRQTITEFRKEIEAGNPSDVLLRNLKKFIDHRYSIKVNSAKEAVSVIERKCTPFNITPLEEVTKELNCTKARQYVDDYKEAVTRCKVTGNSQNTDSHLLQMEKLTIELECDHCVYQAEREELLCDLFSTLVTGVVKMHHSKDNIIICSFPPTCATLLMKIVLANQSKCLQKGIKSITVGYCPLWNKEMCDEMYSAMESKIKELSKKVKSCEDEIISLEKSLKDKNEECAHLQKELEKLKEENDTLTKNLAVMETTICDEKSDHEKEKSDMELQLSKVREELEKLKQLLKKRDEENEALCMTETELREQVKTKSEMMRKMTQEIEQLRSSFSQTKGELEASLLTMKSEILSLQEKLQSLKGKDQQQLLEIEQLQSSLQAKEDKALLMEKSLQLLKVQVYSLKMEQEHAIEESLLNENLQAELQEKDEALSLKQHQLQSFKVAKSELEENLQQSNQEIELLQERISLLNMQLIHKEMNQRQQLENIRSQQSPSTTENVSVSTSTDDATDDSTLQEEIELTETSASTMYDEMEYDEMEQKEKEKKAEELKKVSSFKKAKSPPTLPTIESCLQGQKPYVSSSPIYQSLLWKFALFVATNSSPTSIVDNKELKSFLKELNPRFTPPSRSAIDREISRLLVELKRRISVSLEEGGKIALTIDIWSKKGMSESFLGVTSHCFLKRSHTLFRATLAVKLFPHPHTAERILQLTRDVLREWEIDVMRVSRIVTDNGSNMVAAFREANQIMAEHEEEEEVVMLEEEAEEAFLSIEDISVEEDSDNEEESVNDKVLQEITEFDLAENQHDSVFASLNRLSCFSHTLQLVPRQFDACTSVKKVLAKVYSLVKKFNKSSKATEKLIMLSKKKLLSHCPTRWSSTHIVVSRLLELRCYVTDVCLELDWNCLQNSDWKTLESYKALLDPFAHYTQLASAENSATISSIIPIVTELGLHLKEMGEKPGLAMLSTLLLKELNRRFQKVSDTRSAYFDSIYVAATYLDPRYRLVLSREQISEAKRAIISFSEKDDSSDSDDQLKADSAASQSLEEPPKKKFKHFALMLSRQRENLSQSLDNISKIEEEMCLYEKQNLEISEDIDPIAFWLSSSQSYPKLFDIATDILSIPASSAPVERVFSVSGDACRGKRNRLSGQNLERETLLRVNKALLL